MNVREATPEDADAQAGVGLRLLLGDWGFTPKPPENF